jgi:hypothetical protein
MGRKGTKGFLKGVHARAGPEAADSDDDKPAAAPSTAAEGSEAASAGATAAPASTSGSAKAAAAPAKAEDKPSSSKPAPAADSDADDDDDDDDDGAKGPETRGKMLKRHKRVRVSPGASEPLRRCARWPYISCRRREGRLEGYAYNTTDARCAGADGAQAHGAEAGQQEEGKARTRQRILVPGRLVPRAGNRQLEYSAQKLCLTAVVIGRRCIGSSG